MKTLEHQLALLKLMRDGCAPGSWLWQKRDQAVRDFINQHFQKAA